MDPNGASLTLTLTLAGFDRRARHLGHVSRLYLALSSFIMQNHIMIGRRVS